MSESFPPAQPDELATHLVTQNYGTEIPWVTQQPCRVHLWSLGHCGHLEPLSPPGETQPSRDSLQGPSLQGSSLPGPRDLPDMELTLLLSLTQPGGGYSTGCVVGETLLLGTLVPQENL